MSSTTSPLRSLFLNCQGLSPLKFSKLESLLLHTLPKYDFIFVVETWLQDLPKWRASPTFVIHSLTPPISPNSIRGHGGLLYLAPPGHLSVLSSLSSTTYSLT